jgi:RimJ/RimL family protein N-acetyltransferase
LKNPKINQYLETRWENQNLNKIKIFVKTIEESRDSILFAIEEISSNKHIGNIKIGPINHNHKYADISYFIGDSDSWGKGYATEAVALVTHYAFNYLDLENILAGVYGNNVGSQRVLEKVGYVLCGKFINQLLNVSGDREDHYWYGISRSELKL